MGIVAGLDGCKTGWVGVVLEEGRYVEKRSFHRAVDVFAAWPEVAVLAIDIPIGLPEESTAYRREAGPRAGSHGLRVVTPSVTRSGSASCLRKRPVRMR